MKKMSVQILQTVKDNESYFKNCIDTFEILDRMKKILRITKHIKTDTRKNRKFE